MNSSKTKWNRAAFICGALFTLSSTASYADSFTLNTTADAFMAAGSASNPVGSDLTGLNFGGAGTLAISPANSTKGEFDSVIKFNTASVVSQLNSTYGAGNWQITGATLSLSSNFGGQGEQPGNAIFNSINAGSFGIDWLATDSWVEGTGGGMGSTGYPNNTSVSFNSISGLLAGGIQSLGTYTYTPPGDNVYASYNLPVTGQFLSDTSAGGDVSLYFYAADDQVGYLFNSRSFASGHPELILTAEPVPEPGTWALFALATGGFAFSRRQQKNK